MRAERSVIYSAGKEMSAPILTFFNNKGGVGKTSLIYHLAWSLADQEKRVIVADLDPQANLTASFLRDEQIEKLWDSAASDKTIYHAVSPIADVRDIKEPYLHEVAPNLSLLPGDIRLSEFEETLSNAWPGALGTSNLYRPMRIISSFWQILQMASKKIEAQIILIDIGPNLGAINRSAVLATDHIAIPLGADLFSLQGLRNLGPTLKRWRVEWKEKVERWNKSQEAKKQEYKNFNLPEGKMQPVGYLCQQYGVRLSRPVQAYDKWVKRIPNVYRSHLLDDQVNSAISVEDDPYCLATVKHYRSLVPMAQEHRKPIFKLTPADGAIGSHANTAQDAQRDFQRLSRTIAEKIGMEI